MQHVTRLCWHLTKTIAIALCIEFIFAGSNISIAQESPSTAGQEASERHQENDLHIRLPPQRECLKEIGDWSEPEKWAWTQICAREPIDFNKLYGETEDLDRLATDSRRRLGGEFLRQIFEDYRLLPYTQNASIDIIGAFLPTIQIGNTSIGSLNLSHSKVGDVHLNSITLLRNITMSYLNVGKVDLRNIQGGSIVFFDLAWAKFLCGNWRLRA